LKLQNLTTVTSVYGVVVNSTTVSGD